MMFNFPPLIWLRAFEATARHLSFTNAAEELSLTQAAVSKQVKLLEQHLGRPLFIRHVRRLELTKTGEAYLPKINDAFELLDDGTAELFTNLSPNQVTIRSSQAFAVKWLAKRLPEFHKSHPEVKLRITSNVWNEELVNGGFHFDIRYGIEDWEKPDVSRLTWETVTPLCSPSTVKEFKLERPDDLYAMSLVQVLGYRDGWASWFRQMDIKEPNISILEVDSSLVALELAANGPFITLGRSSIAKDQVESGLLIKPFEYEMKVQEAFYLLASAPSQQQPHANTFRRWLLNQVHSDTRFSQ